MTDTPAPDDGIRYDDEVWPIRCIHIERGELRESARLTRFEVRNTRPIERGMYHVDADITLCPFCTGALLGTINKLFRSGAVRDEPEDTTDGKA